MLFGVSSPLKSCNYFLRKKPCGSLKGPTVIHIDKQLVFQTKEYTLFQQILIFPHCVLDILVCLVTEWTITDWKTYLRGSPATQRFGQLFVSFVCPEILNFIPLGILMSGPKPFYVSPGQSVDFHASNCSESLGNGILVGSIRYINILEQTKPMTNSLLGASIYDLVLKAWQN